MAGAGACYRQALAIDQEEMTDLLWLVVPDLRVDEVTAGLRNSQLSITVGETTPEMAAKSGGVPELRVLWQGKKTSEHKKDQNTHHGEGEEE